jgi:predicted RND superfamily exporter protein
MSLAEFFTRLLQCRRLRVGILLVALATAVPAGCAMQGLYARLNSDLEALLPANSAAVLGVQTLRQRMEGSQHLAIVIRGGRSGPPLEFATKLGARLGAYAATQPGLIRSVRTDVAAERSFGRIYGAFYIPLADLQNVHAQLSQGIQAYRQDASSARGAPARDAAADTLAARLRILARKLDPFADRFPGDRLVSNDGRVALVLVFLSTADTGTAMTGPIVARVQAEVAALDPASRGLEIGYAGDVAIAVEELSALRADIGVSALLVILGIGVALGLYFRWWGALLAIAVPLGIGTAWGFGLASLFVHSLCSSTAFLGSIVVGNGINAGIILVSRYTDERRRGAAPPDAVRVAVRRTWGSTLAATLAASAGYASLMISSFRGFNEFAVIGSIGMLSCWCATYLLLPVILLSLDRRGHVVTPHGRLTGLVGAGLEFLVARRARMVLLVGGALLLASLIAAARFDASRIEYDMSRLRSRDSAIHGEGYWSRQMDAVLGRNFTGVVLMSDTAADAAKVAANLHEAVTREPLRSVASTVVTPDDLIPADLAQRREEIRATVALLPLPVRGLVPLDVRRSLKPLLAAAEAPELTPAQLPELLALGLRERDGQFGRTSILQQSLDGSTWNGALTIRAAEALRRVADQAHPPARIAGGFFVSGEILEALEHDALPTTLAAFAGVVLVVLLLFRLRPESLQVIAALLAGVTLLAGAIMALNLRINFLNFMAFPITFGIGVEYAINMLQRFRETPGDLAAVLRRTGSAVALCSFTTILGYGSLLAARNQALFSFGVVAVLGEIACLTTALLLPAALRLRADPAP